MMSELPVDSAGSRQPLFRDLTADEEDLKATEIESLCMECGRNGTTRLLLTKIPMFKEVIVSSFHCPHCGTSNSSLQPGAAIEERGVKYTFKVQEHEHLNRLVVKADTASVQIPELEFEIPPCTQEGSITTVESILKQAVEGLEKEQPVRKALHPDLAAKLDEFIGRLKDCAQLKQPFTVVIDDPTGNSYIENKLAPQEDPNLNAEHYERSELQNRQLGAATVTESESLNNLSSSTEERSEAEAVTKDEVLSFPTNCYHCNSPAETRMKIVDVPHFKQVVVMATTCDYCGNKSNEVKSGSGVSEFGTRIKLKLTQVSDLSRDLVQSETSVLSIPSLEFECEHSSLGGRFTTVEGMLVNVKAELEKSNPFLGDSSTHSKLKDFLEKLSEIIDGKTLGVEIILDDPAGNSFIQNVHAPDPDPEMTVTYYQRTAEQNEQLGLNDMKTEDYTAED